jgi:threonine/homoserine/homoserine lactone efflux protein
MIENLAALLLAALALMGSPGPATLSTAATGAAYGVRRGMFFATGIMLGTASVLMIVASGVTGALLVMPSVRIVLIAAASAYILYLAFRIATAPPVEAAASMARAPGFAPAYLLAIANPKAYAAIGAVYSGFDLLGGATLPNAVLKVAILAGVIVAVNLTWLVLGASISSLFRSARWSRVINVTFAAMLVLSVMAVAFL